MKLEEIEREAVALPDRDRVSLVCKLLDTLPAPRADVSDEEIVARDRELQSGAVEDVPHDEFVRRVTQERRR